MIDLDKLNRLTVSPSAFGQRFVAKIFLWPNYSFPLKPTRIVMEGEENLPRGKPVVFVMNHTDRYNYWPFQYQLLKDGFGLTCPWVKGKYYESKALACFLDACNNIPLPSKGYVMTKDFQGALGRLPKEPEYAALKKLIDGVFSPEQASGTGGEAVLQFLSQPVPGEAASYAESLEARFTAMMRRVVELSRDGMAKGHHILIFPQGTRSLRLLPGHTGAAQFALSIGATVVPVGCNGSEKCYPTASPLSKGGTVTYRIGKPLTPEGDLKPFQVNQPFTPFTRDAEPYAPNFRGATDLMMERINELLDPCYQFDPSARGAKSGAERFV